ncbi:MAG: gluconolactonase [Candidatus Binatia bacterium]|jgi:gluconolactonase
MKIKKITALLSLLLMAGAMQLRAQDLRARGDRAILSDASVLEALWNQGEFTEGVTVAPDGTIYFSDISRAPDKPGTIYRFDPATRATTVHCANSGKSNGLMFDRGGRLIACCGANNGANGGGRALCVIDPDGQLVTLVDNYEGKRLMSPNDLVIHPDGSIYFSDPRYVGSEPIELDQMSLYRFVPDTGELTRLTTEDAVQKPNGVHLAPDLKTIYVAETNNGTKDASTANEEIRVGRMRLNAFKLKKDGTLGRKKVIAAFGTETGVDGMAIDVKGNIYAAVRMASRHGIVVFSPTGKERAFIPTAELPTNCCFGIGDEASTLYVTSGGGLYRIPLKIEGFHPATASFGKKK